MSAAAAEAPATTTPNTWLLRQAPRVLADQLAKFSVRAVTAKELIEDRRSDIAMEFDHALLAKALAHARALVEEHEGEGPRLHRMPGAFDDWIDVHAVAQELQELHIATAPYRKAAGLKP